MQECKVDVANDGSVMTDGTDVRGLEAELAEVEDAIATGDIPDTLGAAEITALEARKAELERLIAEATAEQPAAEPAPAVDYIPAPAGAGDPEDFAPAGADLVAPGGPSTPEDTFVVLDRHDEDKIIRELERRAHDALFYKFKQKGKDVIGLSVQGVLECIGQLNATGKARVTVDPRSRDVVKEQVDDTLFVVATVYAVNELTGLGVFGTSRQPEFMQLTEETARRKRSKGDDVRPDHTIFDPFAATKALNKAQRNALEMLIPQRIRLAMIAWASQSPELVREILVGVGAKESADRPALDTPEAAALVDECKALYDDLRKVKVTALLPGQFFQRLQNSHHSIATLEAFRDFLQAAVQHEAAALPEARS